MSVVWAREHWEGRDGSFENVLNNTLTRTWKVKTDNRYDNQIVIVSHFADTMGIAFLSPHPTNAFYTARKLDVKQDSASPIAWRVTVTYSTEPLKEDEDEPENPLDKPVRVSWDSELAEVFTTKDKDGKAMLNAAGDPFEPVEKDDVRWTIKLTKNFASIPAWVANFVNKVNSSSISIGGITLAERTCKVQALKIGEKQIQNDVEYIEVSVEIAYKPQTWDLDRLEEGFHFINEDGFREKILLSDGKEPSEPVPLDAGGNVLENPTPDNAVYLTKKIYDEADLNDLPFS